MGRRAVCGQCHGNWWEVAGGSSERWRMLILFVLGQHDKRGRECQGLCWTGAWGACGVRGGAYVGSTVLD